MRRLKPLESYCFRRVRRVQAVLQLLELCQNQLEVLFHVSLLFWADHGASVSVMGGIIQDAVEGTRRRIRLGSRPFFAAEGLQVVRDMSRYLLVLHGGLQFSSHLVGINNQALAASIGSAIVHPF